MPKKTASTFKKSFNIDLDSLLMTDFIEEKEKITEPSSPEHWNPLKKFKTDTTKLQTEMKPNAEENVGNTYEKSSKTSQDVSKFFENFGNDFNKSMQVKKGRLTQFTKMVASTYQTKVSEMMKKQEAEVDLLKKEAIKNIMGNFEQFEKEFQKLIQQENKLTKFLEQHIKMIAKSSAIQEQWIEDLTQVHKNFVHVNIFIKIKKIFDKIFFI